MFSLQQLLCKDVEALNTAKPEPVVEQTKGKKKPPAKKRLTDKQKKEMEAASKTQEVQAKTEDDEFEAFIKQ